ncbi:MAG: carboxypeptidase regulatory-like domain-containing protein [Acidobacteriota bacterium]|nr:carboxypeptidase regulatory-like domain-containing protein [Acidobacteriota bacterium]
MKRAWLLPLAFALLSTRGASAAEITGQVIDSQTGEPIPRAHVTIQAVVSGSLSTGLAVLTDVAGFFTASNLPNGSCQISGEKAGYLGASITAQAMVVSGEAKPAMVLRLIRQGVIEGSVVDQKGAGVPLASVQLFRSEIVNGKRRIRPFNGAQTDATGEFRISGLRAGSYYVGANASIVRVRDSKKFAYAPILYPGATEIASAQPIALLPGKEERIAIQLEKVATYQVRGQVTSAERNPPVSLRPQEPDRFPLSPILGSSWDEKTNTLTMSGIPPGLYVIERSTQIEGRQRRAIKTIAIGDKDVDGVLLEPGLLPEITGWVTVDSRAAPNGAVSYVGLRSLNNEAGAQVGDGGSFHMSDLFPGSYQVVVSTVGSYYVRSIRQGGRDVQREAIAIGESPLSPLDIDLGLHGATIDGTITMPDSDPHGAIVVGLFNRVGEGLVLEKQAYINGSAAHAKGRASAFIMPGVAPGDYVLYAWPTNSQIEYAEPEFMRRFEALGKTIRITEGARTSVVLDALLPTIE